MDKAKIAEWFMSLVMTRLQAAAVIGDLLEIGTTRSAGWFWSNVTRTWFATVWSDVKAEPRFFLGMAALSSLVYFGVTALAEFAFVFSYLVVGDFVLPHFSLHSGSSVITQLEMLTAFFAGAFYAGQWIARYSLGREIAICCAMVVVQPIVMLVLSALLWMILTLAHAALILTGFTFTALTAAWLIFPMIPCFLGAVWARNRAQATRAVSS